MTEHGPRTAHAPALLLIDLQRAIDDPRWAVDGPRNHPDAEANVARLLAAWRRHGRVVLHVRHDSREPDSTFRPDGPGTPFKMETSPAPGEHVFSKHTANAFLSTDLDAQLRARGLRQLVVAGVITNNSVESTVRMAGELGYDVTVVDDACFTFARRDRRGRLWAAEDVHALSLANLEQGGYARIATAAELCAVA